MKTQQVHVMRGDVSVNIDSRLEVSVSVGDEQLDLGLTNAYILLTLLTAATKALEEMID